MPAISVRALTPEQAAYIAGLIDGEGTITLTREHRGECRRLVVSIANTGTALLNFVSEAAGVGKITRKRAAKPEHTPSFVYRITSRQALALLRQVEPHLRSYKKLRARAALTMYAALTPRNGNYSELLWQQREKFENDFLAISAEVVWPRSIATPPDEGALANQPSVYISATPPTARAD